ncbi:oxidoreductase [Lacinutrix sp. MEBiC02404]
MKNSMPLVVVLCFLFSCGKKEVPFKVRDYKTVEIKTLLADSLLNVRALEIDFNGFGSFATSNGKIGGIAKNDTDEEARLTFQLKEDSITPNFRSLAVTNNAGFVLSIASPALLYKIDADSLKIVYRENHEKAFYDALDFWNDQEGIAIGDPTDDCMSIIITRDGGDTWNKISCANLPKAQEGEAAFAASDTNIAIVGDKTWIATGGKASRILFSPDKGKTWEVFETPIVQGLETTGMYSVDFYDEKNGFAIGGDYTKAADSSANKIRTQDGGKTWQLVAQNQSPGYRSCVQYVPNSDAKALVAIGFKGIDYSSDAGNTWKHLSDEGFYTLRFLNDSTAYAAGAGRISKLTFK